MAKAITDIRSLCRTHTAMAVRVLAQIARQKTAPPSARVAAAEALIDRGWGKALQMQQAEITHRYVIEIPAVMDDAEWELEGQIDGQALPAPPITQ